MDAPAEKEESAILLIFVKGYQNPHPARITKLNDLFRQWQAVLSGQILLGEASPRT